MEPETLIAPPVVAVVVVHDPDEWFGDAIDAFAEQDYPNLRYLFLVTDGDADGAAPSGEGTGTLSLAELEAQVAARLENAFVRPLGANPGFAVAANEVLRLVEGQNGFFLFCHDDIAPDPTAIRLMVEEMYRSNAGVVGPKLVDWDDPRVLQSVGLGLDRFGEIDQPVEPDEVDQEQHDGVRDVFVVPSACLLVRADLFRELGGFDPTLVFAGDDVEFCWRVHHSGARVIVAPSARVRHRGRLAERRPDLPLTRLQARARLRTVATLTGATRLPGRLLELVVLSIAELVVGLFTGRFRQGLASVGSLLGLVPRIPALVARRRSIAPIRRVPEREVLGLQRRGSARLASYLRARELATYASSGANVRRWRDSTTAPVIAWLVVLVLLGFGSRSILSGGVPTVGQFLRFPDSPRELLDRSLGGWNATGLGATDANPTGMTLLSVASVVTLFHMGLLHTVFVLGLVVTGLIGIWKLSAVFVSTRARIGMLVVYSASPLVGGALAIGAFDVLVAFASVPWMLHTLRRAVGIDTADPRSADDDLADGMLDLTSGERIRRTAQFGIVVALAASFGPVHLVMALVLGVLMAVASLVALAPVVTALRCLAVSAVGVLGAVIVNFPWIAGRSWEAIVGPSPIGDPGRGLRALASFEIGPTDFASLTLALYVPVLAALLIARAWRLTWAVRASVLVVGFGLLAVWGDRGSLPFAAPRAGILLVPVAVGVAIAAGSALSAFDLDVRGGSFGWRQPLGIVAGLAVVVGVFPAVVGVSAGDWKTPTTPLVRLVEARLPDVPADGDGDYHVLLLGDARLLPVPAVPYRDGVSFAVMSDDPLDVASNWPAPDAGNQAIIDALDQIASGSTQRAGRLLAPLGIRYIVVPELDGIVSTSAKPLDLPIGLVSAFDEQLDIVAAVGLPTVEFFENTSWLPTYSLLTGPTAAASRTAGDAALVRADLGSVTPRFSGTDAQTTSRAEVEPGVVHLAVPFDENWRLDVDGVDIPARRAFGVTTAFDVEQAGIATLSYSTPSSRPLMLFAQLVLWIVLVLLAVRMNAPWSGRRRPLVSGGPVLTLGDGSDTELLDVVPAMFDPGLDVVSRVEQITAAGIEPEFVGDEVEFVDDVEDIDILVDAADADADAAATDAGRDAEESP